MVGIKICSALCLWELHSFWQAKVLGGSNILTRELVKGEIQTAEKPCPENQRGKPHPNFHSNQSSSRKQGIFTMLGGFIIKEPSNSKKLRETPEVVDLFTCAKWMTFCDKIQGHDDEITEEFLRSLQPKSKTLETINFRGLTLKLTPQLISRVTELPLGMPKWFRC